MRATTAALLTACLLAMMSGPAALAVADLPPERPDLVQDERAVPLSAAERRDLESHLLAHSGPERYKVLLVDDAGPDPTAFISAVWAQWSPGPDTVLILVSGTGQVRFYLGADLGGWGLGTNAVLRAIRERYVPAANAGGVSAGLTALVTELHWQILAGGALPEAPETEEPPDLRDAGAPRPWFRDVDWRTVVRSPWTPALVALAGLVCLVWAWVDYARRKRRWLTQRQGTATE